VGHQKTCTVSFCDSSGIGHAVDVGAETLYEAAVLALKSFRDHECAPAQVAELSIEVKNPSVTHTITVRKLVDWLNGSAKSPKEALDKSWLREVLGLSSDKPPLERIGGTPENFRCITHDPYVTDLERSHCELRATLILAGKEIRRLNFGRRDNPVLVKMRQVLRDAREVAHGAKPSARIRIKLTK
jgi:hypothetical protein